MSMRNHRDDRARKKFHKARMPAPSEAKLGTRVHQTERYEEDDTELDVDKCFECDQYTPVNELDSEGICDGCREEQEDQWCSDYDD